MSNLVVHNSTVTWQTATGSNALRGVTGVMLEHADPEDVRELVVEAWCNKAPPALVEAFLDG